MLILIRGISGSGKSTLGNKLLGDGFLVSADDYFMVNHRYTFDPSRLSEAHAQCQNRTENFLRLGHKVVVHNTFSTRWEMELYLKMGESLGIQVIVVDLFDGGKTDQELFARNVHGVPLQTIQKMRRTWEHNWRFGNPIPPWER